MSSLWHLVTMRGFSLRARLIVISLTAVAATTVACLIIQRAIIREQGISLTRTAMQGVLLSAENVRESVTAMRVNGVFRDDLRAQDAGVKDFRASKTYETVPVVSAWRSISLVSAREGYTFHIAAQPGQRAASGG